MSLKDDQELGMYFLLSAKVSGEMNITAGIDNDGKVTGVKLEIILKQRIRLKATDPKFLHNLKILSERILKIIKAKRKPEEINAVSGATVTSTTITNAVQAALNMSAKLGNEGGGSSE